MKNQQPKSWRDIMGGKYFTARFLHDGLDQEVTISNVEVKEINPDEFKIVLTFEGWEKPLIMNVSNCWYTEWALGTDDYREWVGEKIILYKDTTTYEGQEMDTVRVRPYDSKLSSPNNSKAHAEVLEKFELTGRDIWQQKWDRRKAVMVSNYMMQKAGVEDVTEPEKLGIKPLTELTDMMLEKATAPQGN